MGFSAVMMWRRSQRLMPARWIDDKSARSSSVTTITVTPYLRKVQPGLLATLGQLLRCSMEHQIGTLRNVRQSGGNRRESPKACDDPLAEGRAASPMMLSMEFTGLGKSTTALIAAVVQTNLQAVRTAAQEAQRQCWNWEGICPANTRLF